MRRIAILTGHYPPSNLAGVHRARLWAQYLAEFGWQPIIVTTHWKYYEEELDEGLLDLVAPNVQVIRTDAFPVTPVKLVGDVGLRGLYWHLKAIDALISGRQIDFLHITIPSNYSALVGELIYRRHRFPFGIDYQDPWIYPLSGAEKRGPKARVSRWLAKKLEPWAVRNASLITGVAHSYFEGVLARNQGLQNRCVTASMPIGHSEMDYRLIRNSSRQPFLFGDDQSLFQQFQMIYAGAMLPKAYAVLERLMEALVLLRDRDRSVMDQLRIHFVGTGKSPDDPEGYNIRPYIQRYGLEGWVREHPQRIGYVDVLSHLAHASGILIVGSTEPHYTPSKVYQAVQAQRPVFALLHEQSSAVQVLRESGAGQVVTLTEDRLPDAGELAAAIASFVRNPQYSPNLVQWNAFEAFSARNSARSLARAVDQALLRFDERR
jgi:hypothetical protein